MSPQVSKAAGYHREDACDRRLFVRPGSVMKIVSEFIGKLYSHSLNLNNRYYLGFCFQVEMLLLKK